MKKVIINADDFGYNKSINKGILEAINSGVVSSTSVMVYGRAAEEAVQLKDIENISVGLHLQMEKTSPNPKEEFDKQVRMFTELLGRKPDHIDVHKPRSSDMTQILPLLEKYSEKNKTPVRELGHAKSVKNFFGINTKNENGIEPERVSVESLLNILKNLENGTSEIMTHAGYSNDELREMSSYNDTRELELQTLTNKRVVEYFEQTPDLQLISWNAVPLSSADVA